jgi:type IV pilus assembly protein PilF
MRNWAAAVAAVLLILALTACAPTNVNEVQTEKPAKVNVELGKAYMRQNNYNEAMIKLNRALKEDPNYAPAHSAIAVLYDRLEEVDKADEHYRKALELDPKNSLIHNNYGAFLCKRDHLQEADAQFQLALKDPLYPTPEYAYTNAGLCALRIPDLEKAETYFRAALQRQPKFPVALFQMAKLNFDAKNYLPARAYIQRYLEAGPETPSVLWMAVQVERELGDRNASASYAMRLKGQFPESEETRLLLGNGAE